MRKKTVITAVSVAALAAVLFSVLMVLHVLKRKDLPEHTQGDITKADDGPPALFPDGTWYDGQSFTFLISGNSSHNDFHVSESFESNIDSERYALIRSFREKYGIHIKTDDKTAPNSSGGDGVGYECLRESFLSEKKEYDAAMIGTYDAANAACRGYLSNLNSEGFSYLDMTRAWWDQNARSTFELDGKLFYASGDITLSENINQYCVVFNKTVEAAADIKDPCKMVESGEWTWDAFSEEIKRASVYLAYGLQASNNSVTAVYSSADNSVSRVSRDGEMILSVYSDEADALFDKYVSLLLSGKVTDDGNALERCAAAYAITTLGTAQGYADSGLQCAFLPMPKLTAEQENFRCLVSVYHTQFLCVPFYVSDKQMTGGVLEELAYNGRNSITPAYKEELLSGNTYDYDMLSTVFSSTAYDIGMNYKIGGFATEFTKIASLSKNTLAEMVYALESSAEAEISEINKSFDKILNSKKY